MAFISKQALKKMVEVATAVEHPLLREINVDIATKTAYVQGCALATLIDDEKTSESERTVVRGIGLSLRLTEDEIEECFSVVSGLSSDEDKSQFIEEITTILQKGVVGRFFMEDFEKVAGTNGEPTGEVLELIDYVGALIYKDADWRSKKMAEEEQRRQENIHVEVEEVLKIRNGAENMKKGRELLVSLLRQQTRANHPTVASDFVDGVTKWTQSLLRTSYNKE